MLAIRFAWQGFLNVLCKESQPSNNTYILEKHARVHTQQKNYIIELTSYNSRIRIRRHTRMDMRNTCWYWNKHVKVGESGQLATTYAEAQSETQSDIFTNDSQLAHFQHLINLHLLRRVARFC